MTHPRLCFGGARKPVPEVTVTSLKPTGVRKPSPRAKPVPILFPKPAGVRKPSPRAKPVPILFPKPAGVRKPSPRAEPVADKTATRSATCAYAWQAAVVLKDEKSEESDDSTSSSESESGSSDSSEDLSPIHRGTSRPKASVAHPKLKPSALPAPVAPAHTESEIENLMTIGRKQVEKKLKDRINQEKEKNCLLKKQMTTFENYKKYLAKLKDLEEELTELKEENSLNEDTVSDLAEDFRESTMEWAKLFEKYAGDLGISVFDIRRLAGAW